MNLPTIKKEKTNLNPLKKKLVVYLTPQEFNKISEMARTHFLTKGRYSRKILLESCAEYERELKRLGETNEN